MGPPTIQTKWSYVKVGGPHIDRLLVGPQIWLSRAYGQALILNPGGNENRHSSADCAQK